MQLTFLSADVPLVKTYSKVQGTLTKSPYPHVTYFTSHTEHITDIKEFHTALVAHAKQGHCLLKGNVQRPLNHESRAGSTDSDAETQWVCLDIDGLQGHDNPKNVMALLGLADVDYIIQYSASHGVEEQRGMSCHIFFLLDAPVRAPILKSWLMHLNLNTRLVTSQTTPILINGRIEQQAEEHIDYPLRDQIRLTRAGAALRWPLDITVCQNDKLLFIAPPTLNDVTCSLKPRDRVKLVTNELRALPTARLAMSQLPQTKAQADELRDELRAANNFPKLRKNSLKWENGIEIQRNPGQALVTGIKQERGFTYLNLNGGDSWGYYHPETDARLISNFKGEPIYKTEELLPEYWANWCTRLATETDPLKTGIEYFAVCDAATSAYFVGEYHCAEDTITIDQAKSETQVKSFLKEHNLPVGEFIPRWTVRFDPHSPERFDKINQVINLYKPSPLLKELSAKKRFTKEPPTSDSWPLINRIILSAVGSDESLMEPFLNWLACVIQHKRKIGVAWVLHGVQGTGKGLLVNHVLKPIIGEQHVGSQLMSRFGGRFNANLEDKLLILVDEARIGAATNAKELSETIKHLITEDPIDIERKFANSVPMASYVNFIFASNQPDPVHIDTHDRRFNLAAYQKHRLEVTDEQLTKQLPKELPFFAEYLYRRTADMTEARRIINTEARQGVINLSSDSGTMLADALRSGDVEIFIDALRDIPQGLDHSPQHIAYESWILGTMKSIVAGDNTYRLTRDEIGMIYQYCIGDTVPLTPTKLTQYLHHKGLRIANQRIDGRVQRGIAGEWSITPAVLERIHEHLASQQTPVMRRVK